MTKQLFIQNLNEVTISCLRTFYIKHSTFYEKKGRGVRKKKTSKKLIEFYIIDTGIIPSEKKQQTRKRRLKSEVAD